MDVIKTLPGLPFWDRLSEEEKEEVQSGAVIREYPEGTDIHGFSDACLGMVLLEKGSIRVYMTSQDGREVTLWHLTKGDCCIFSSACVISQISLEVQMMAEQPVELTAIHAGTVSRLMESNLEVKCFVYELATKRYATVVWVLQQILFDHFDQRLARYLLTVYQTTGNTTIRMTQEKLAQEVNSAREVVARMLRHFADEGWITLGRGTIVLKNLPALQNLCE